MQGSENTIWVANSVFKNNAVNNYALNIAYGTTAHGRITIQNNEFTGNNNGLYISNNVQDSTVIVANNTVNGNYASGMYINTVRCDVVLYNGVFTGGGRSLYVSDAKGFDED